MVIKQTCKDIDHINYKNSIGVDHHHYKSTKGNPPPVIELSRQEEVALHHLRVDHSPKLNATRHRWGKPDANDGNCTTCGTKEDASHVILDCAQHTNARLLELGPNPDLDVLNSNPRAVVRYLWKIGWFNNRPDMDHQRPSRQ